MANDFTVGWLDELRTIPKGFGQWCKAKRGEKAFAHFHHVLFSLATDCAEIRHLSLLITLGDQKLANVISDIA